MYYMFMFMFMFLQLLDEFMTYVAAIERLAFHSRRWRTTKIGDSIPNVESHAAAIILVVMKLQPLLTDAIVVHVFDWFLRPTVASHV